MIATSQELTAEARSVLLVLYGSNSLKRYARNGEWMDTRYQDTYSPATCRWLADNGYIQSRAILRGDEVFTLSNKGYQAVAEYFSDRLTRTIPPTSR